MCNIYQCQRCRQNFMECGYYNNDNNELCQQFTLPIDNSRMFGRWYKFSGRIGRLEYALTLIFAIVLYLVLTFAVYEILSSLGILLTTPTRVYLYTFGCMIPSVYITIAAGVKRAHDSTVSPWYSLTPLIPLFFLNIITFVIFCAGCVFLFKDKGEDGVNEYGSNPVQPYNDQLQFEEII